MPPRQPAPPASLTPAVVFRLLRDHAWLWIAPTIAATVLTAGATLLTARKWKATQGMIVRSEAAGYADQRLGKFTDLSEMRTVQETVLEVARSRTVLTAALGDVGPRPSLLGNFSEWPSAEDIDDLRGRLSVSPPGGAEFGATEVFYLTVLDKDPDRAVALVDAIATRLDERMQGIRNQQADSIVQELQHSVTAEREALESNAYKLAVMEADVGLDLGDLRNLVASNNGQGFLSQKSLAVEAELRDSEANRRRASELLATLRQAQDNPRRLLATPSALLASQPALDRFKAGLIDSQIQAATLRGRLAADHPFVAGAEEAQAELRSALRAEIPTAIAGVELDLLLSRQREAALKKELVDIAQRGQRLANKRAEYALLVAAVDRHVQLVGAAEAQLADARAHSAGAQSASVLARVDSVEAGIRPVGPGRTTVTMAGGMGGLILGVGLVMLIFGPRPAASQPDVRPGTWQELFPNKPAANQSTPPAQQSTQPGRTV